VPSPIEGDINQITQADKDLLADHAYQVQQCLPGGSYVRGLYVVSPSDHSHFISLVQYVRKCLQYPESIRFASVITPLVQKRNQVPPLLINISPESYQLYLIQQGQLLAEKLTVTSCFLLRNFTTTPLTIPLPASGEKLPQTMINWIKQLSTDEIKMNFYGSFIDNQNADQCVEFSMESEPLTVFTDPKWHAREDKEIQGAWMTTSLSLLSVAPASHTLGERAQFVWEDLVRSLLQRADIMASYQEAGNKHGFPMRVYYSPDSSSCLSDYLLPDEACFDSMKRFQELFSLDPKDLLVDHFCSLEGPLPAFSRKMDPTDDSSAPSGSPTRRGIPMIPLISGVLLGVSVAVYYFI